jgi:DNA-binding PadR family transcriptional regulator/flagellin-specific chaperone FliS
LQVVFEMNDEETTATEIAKSLYREKRLRYYIEGILLTAVLGAGIFYLVTVSSGIAIGNVFSIAWMWLSLILAGIVTTLIISYRILTHLPGLKPRLSLRKAPVLLAISFFTVSISVLLVAVPVLFIVAFGWVDFQNQMLAAQASSFLGCTVGAGVAAVATSAWNTTKLSEDEEFSLLSALDKSLPHQQQSRQTLVREATSADHSDSTSDKTVSSPSSADAQSGQEPHKNTPELDQSNTTSDDRQAQQAKAVLDDAEEELDAASSLIAAGDIQSAKTHLSKADRLLMGDNETDIIHPERYETLHARYKSLQTAIKATRRAHARLDTAEDALENVTAHLSEGNTRAAKKQLSTASGRLSKVETEFESYEIQPPDRFDQLQSRYQTLTESLETDESHLQAESAANAAVEAMNRGYKTYEDGSLATAASSFEDSSEQLATVRELDVDPEELSTDRSPESIAAETARGQVYVEMQRAEQRVVDGHDAIEEQDYWEAVEAYEDALSNLRSATAIADEHDLPHRWELDQRQESIAAYLKTAKERRASATESQTEAVRERLDRATRLIETAEQHLELDDPVAAWQDSQKARDIVTESFELLSEAPRDAADVEQRATDLQERIQSVIDDIPDGVQTEETAVTASNRELLTYLQELSVVFGESPKQEFVEEYGAYPVPAYLERFGSWEAALDEANLSPIDTAARGRRVYSRVDILDAIGDLADELDSIPSQTQMNEKGAVSSTTAANRFESWENAVRFAGLETQPTHDEVGKLAAAESVLGDTDRETPVEDVETSHTSEEQPDVSAAETTSDSTATEPAQTTNSSDTGTASTDQESDTTTSVPTSVDIEPSDFEDLSSFHRDILIVLSGLSGTKGLRIKEELEQYYDDEVNHGRLYPNLDTLAEREYIEKFSIDNRSNGYRLSEKGKRHLQHRRRWEGPNLQTGGDSDTNNAERTPSDDRDEASPDSTESTVVSGGTTTGHNTTKEIGRETTDESVDELLDEIEQLLQDDT